MSEATMEFIGEVGDTTYYFVEGSKQFNGPSLEARRLTPRGDRWEITRHLSVQREDVASLIAAGQRAALYRVLIDYPSVTGFISVDDAAALADPHRAMRITASTYRRPPAVQRSASENQQVWP